jgi:hypothetical protein
VNGSDDAEARAGLKAAGEALWPFPDARLGDTAAFRRLAARLENMAAEVARVECVVEGQASVAAR